MVCPVGGLKGLLKLMIRHILVELVGNSFFKDFTDEGKLRDRLKRKVGKV